MADTARRTDNEIQLDNLMRQSLMLSDPQDAGEVARALKRRFSDGAARIESDRTGFQLQQVSRTLAAPVSGGPSDGELTQAKDDLERDLASLVSASQLKDIRPELQGWQRALPELLDRGAASAKLAIHEGHRSAAMAVRQELGDYARLARLLGATTPEFNGAYRSLAKSLDEGAALMVVLAGEAIAGRGFGGIAALPAPVAELSKRRDAVLDSLRSLANPSQTGRDDRRWPRALHALTELYDWLDQSGQGHLRALLDENYLASVLDKLVENAGQSDAVMLRGLGATATVTLAQLSRLATLLARPVNPASPPLATFRQALLLFIRSFRAERGRRLILAARPPLLSYGFYGLANSPSDQRLIQLMVLRGQIAALLDCYLGCGCGENEVVCQVAMDKLLYDIDRAIDRYLQDPTAADTEAELRAAAFGLLIKAARNDGVAISSEYHAVIPGGRTQPIPSLLEPLSHCILRRPPETVLGTYDLAHSFSEVQETLLAPLRDRDGSVQLPLSAERGEVLRAELCDQKRDESRWFEFARAMTPNCTDLDKLENLIVGLIAGGLYLAGARGEERTLVGGPRSANVRSRIRIIDCPPPDSGIAAPYETALDSSTYGYSREGKPVSLAELVAFAAQLAAAGADDTQ